ncbi:MAG: toll/interleukin-1 receptor domain-containing protein [Planctomycetota bacterium]|nr:toll/interleukin-1 receptor domain-containing protein [Planctomycetota bacterium]
MSPLPDNTNYEYDVFLSYACAENEIPAGAMKGWVTVFFETLKAELGKSALGKRIGIRVWWDQTEIDGSKPLRHQILGTLPKTRLLVVLLSQSYLESDWCRDERQAFISAMKDRPLGDQRIFLLDLGNVEEKSRPAEFRNLGLKGFPFYTSDKLKFGHPVPNATWNEHLPFFKDLTKLAEKIAARLGELGIHVPLANQRPDAKPVATVYLAQTTDDLDDEREELAKDLAQHGFRILPDDALPLEQEGCRRKIYQCLDDNPAVFVQLIGPHAGRRFKSSDETVVTLQYLCAIERSPKIPILQWHDKVVSIDGIQHDRLKALLSNPDVRTEPLEAFKAEVRNKATPPKPRQALLQHGVQHADSQPRKLPPAVFVQSDSVDLAAAEQLSKLLTQHLHFRSGWSKSSDDPDEQSAYRDMQQEWLEDCDAIVLLHGIAKAVKIEQLIHRLWKLEQKRDKPLRLKMLYVGPPKDKMHASVGDPNFVEIDCSQDSELNLAKLQLVLATLWQEDAS